jgi:beta-glucanase (GH16 family)
MWTREVGQGYGQETYSSDPSYANPNGSGDLVIQSKKVGSTWYSGQVSTRGHFAMNGGTIEFRAKLPTATGFWPGIWVDPSIHGEAGNSAMGEFDILETFNGIWAGNPAFTTLHYWQDRSAPGVVHSQTQLPQYHVNDGAFHVWRVVWTSGSISLFIDGNLVGSMTAAQFAAKTGHPWPFNDKPAYFVMQLAAMGNGRPWAGVPAPAVSEAQMDVDYLHITKTS